MHDQVIAFLMKYQEMRAARIKHSKNNSDTRALSTALRLELELDALAPLLIAALNQ